jgi:hypothetical protein
LKIRDLGTFVHLVTRYIEPTTRRKEEEKQQPPPPPPPSPWPIKT